MPQGTSALERHQLAEDLAAATLELSAADLADLDRASTEIRVLGDRYPEHIGKMTGL